MWAGSCTRRMEEPISRHYQHRSSMRLWSIRTARSLWSERSTPAPLLNASGRLIDGVGLDRATGLFHRINPALRSCLPQGEPTQEEIKEALKFLLTEWLVDVALDPVGKCVAVLMALTLLQRALLPERPAFFVTAGQRGGGKTTLVHMIMVAVLGRRAAAAGWSESVEERKKALF